MAASALYGPVKDGSNPIWTGPKEHKPVHRMSETELCESFASSPHVAKALYSCVLKLMLHMPSNPVDTLLQHVDQLSKEGVDHTVDALIHAKEHTTCQYEHCAEYLSQRQIQILLHGLFATLFEAQSHEKFMEDMCNFLQQAPDLLACNSL